MSQSIIPPRIPQGNNSQLRSVFDRAATPVNKEFANELRKAAAWASSFKVKAAADVVYKTIAPVLDLRTGALISKHSGAIECALHHVMICLRDPWSWSRLSSLPKWWPGRNIREIRNQPRQ
jgi:hypothetical protein